MKRIIFVLFALTLTGCYAKMLTYKGFTVTKQNDIIQLQPGEQHGQWKTDELEVNYRYQMASNRLNISGSVKLVGGFAIGFRRIENLDVQIFFLDSRGVVIDNAVLYSADRNHPTDSIPMNFDQNFTVPAGTTAISFIYDGRLSDDGGRMREDIGNSP